MLDDARMLEVLDVDLDRLDGVAVDVLDADVAACPGWTVLDLLGHLGVVHWRLHRVLTEGEAYRPLNQQSPPPPADEVVAWRAAGSRAMVDALRAADLDADCDTFAGTAPSRFWLRRMVHETAVHRWDVDAAAGGAPTPLDADVAVDGMDELFDLFVPRIEPSAWSEVVAGTPEASLHAHATDVDGEWLVRLTAGGAVVDRQHAKGDVAARGSASDLALVFWNRLPADVLDRFGDTSLLDRYLATARF